MRFDRTSSRFGSKGQALVEFAIVAPVLLLLLLIAVDFGRVFFSYVAVNNSAREGAYYAAAHAGDDPFDQTAYEAGVVNAALTETVNQTQGGEGSRTVTGPTCLVAGTTTTVDCRTASTNLAGGSGNHVIVSVSQPYQFLTPLVGELFGGQLTLAASATAPVLNPLSVTIAPGPTAGPTASPSPSPSPTPTPAPTATSPGATPTPTPPPTIAPTPTPVPSCIVPDYKGSFWSNTGAVPALQVWQQAGFTGTLTNAAGDQEIWNQTLQKGKSELCTSNMTVSAK